MGQLPSHGPSQGPAAVHYNFFKHDRAALIKKIGKEKLLKALDEMLLIRNFETRAEQGYKQGKMGGFFHAYSGQEAIQTAAFDVMGHDQWWATTYRCHALALLLGQDRDCKATPNDLMAELYGRANGNAQGRGGSMHLYTDRLLGGFGIVGGHLPVATGAALTLKYKGQKGVAICFLGDGAVPQGAVHESWNIAALWDLPCIYVIENNQWGMGTAVHRAIAHQPIAESQAPSYGMKGYTLDGSDYFSCYAGFEHIYNEVVTTSRPVIVEAVTERFKGHSISDPGLYRSKESLLEIMDHKDPIKILSKALIEAGMLTEEELKKRDEAKRDIALAAMEYADKSPFPDVATLEEDVFAPNGGLN